MTPVRIHPAASPTRSSCCKQSTNIPQFYGTQNFHESHAGEGVANSASNTQKNLFSNNCVYMQCSPETVYCLDAIRSVRNETREDIGLCDGQPTTSFVLCFPVHLRRVVEWP